MSGIWGWAVVVLSCLLTAATQASAQRVEPEPLAFPHPDEIVRGRGFAVVADRRTFTVTAFLNAAGYDEEVEGVEGLEMHPVRKRVRELMAQHLRDHQQLVEEWRSFYEEMGLPLFVYLDYALSLSGDHPFHRIRPAAEVGYPQVLDAMDGLLPYLNAFWVAADMEAVWNDVKPIYLSELQRYDFQAMDTEMASLWSYLRLPRRDTYTIVIVPNLIAQHFVGIGAEYETYYYTVETPGAQSYSLNIHEYLHSIVNPAMEGAFEGARAKLMRYYEAGREGEYAASYQQPENFAAESLVRALDYRLRLRTAGDEESAARIQDRVDELTEGGLSLVRPFFDGLAAYESAEEDFVAYLPTLFAGLPARLPTPDDPAARTRWLEANASPLVSLTPIDTAFDDLQPLAEAVGNARIVMLGEASHGDGGTFLGKTRIIEFLHQRLGFDVLVFESGLYECWRAWQAIRSGTAPMEALRMGVFSVWSQSEELLPLARYLAADAQSQHPLEVAGMDIQRSGTVTPEFAGDLADVLRSVAPETLDTPEWTTFLSIQGHLADRSYVAGYEPLPSVEEQEAFGRSLSGLRRRLATVTAEVGALDIAFWDQLLQSLDAYARMVWLVDPANLSETPADGRIRERGMADNLLWMARTRYPDRKLIVWGATRHTARQLAEVEVPRTDIQLLYDSIPTMGQLVWEALGDSVYSLGFTAYEGATATVFGPGGTVPTPSEGSLEDLLARTGRDHAFLNLRAIAPGGAWLLDTLVARPLGYLEMRARWPQVLDGIVFMKTMTPVHRVAESGR